ncbi:hypothetical protein [Corynebacterium hiratae]|uniref:Uncharacterized protein n=1 Tax=Corynebacterium hiratae TaxID=3139423 RepID=A0A553FUP3_9CORY|nr:hypothetical protein [Corynebacterium aurimucosum]TRX60976.1 hypothetical protein FNY97_08515 [Corynebacterium aurimucosum]
MATLQEICGEYLKQARERRTGLLEAQRRGEPVNRELKYTDDFIDMLSQGFDRLNRLKENEQ